MVRMSTVCPGAPPDFIMQTDPPARPFGALTHPDMGMAGSLTHDVIKGPPPPPIERGWGGRRSGRPRRESPRVLHRTVCSAGRQHHGVRGLHQRVRGAARSLRRLGQHAQAADPVRQHGDAAGVEHRAGSFAPRAEDGRPQQVQPVVDRRHRARHLCSWPARLWPGAVEGRREFTFPPIRAVRSSTC